MISARLSALSSFSSLVSLLKRSINVKLMAVAMAMVALLGGAAGARAQSDTCATLNVVVNDTVVSTGTYLNGGDLLSNASSGPAPFLFSTASNGGAPYVRYGQVAVGTKTTAIPFSGYWGFETGAGTATITCTPVINYTVTVSTDTTAGVSTNCKVGSTNDASCSLRDAIAAIVANTNVTSSNRANIYFSTALAGSAGTTPFTITETYATLTVPNNTTIQGLTTGSGASLTNLVTVSGNKTYQVFTVPSGVTATISNLTIANGSTPTQSVVGAGIYNAGTLTLNSSTLTGNSAYVSGSGIYNSGTIYVNDSTITNNSTKSGGNGPAMENAGTATFTNTTIAGNSGSSGNAATLYNYSGTMTITNSTIASNTATVGGGIVINTGTVLANNSIIEGNTGLASDPNVYLVGGTFLGDPYTLYSLNTATPAYTAATLNLAPLGYYGGPTQTMPALPTSPAFCKGNPALLGTDQRGVTTPTLYGTKSCVDIGATNSSYSLVFTTQPASSYPAGANFSPAPVVSFEDDGFVLPATGSVVFSNSGTALSGTTIASLSNGTAALSAASVPTPETGDKLTATAGISLPNQSNLYWVTTPNSNSFNVVNAIAGFTVSPILLGPIPAGTAQSITVTALSALPSTVATGYTGTVAFTSTDSAATLPANLTFLASDNGVHTVSGGLTLKTAGSQTVTATDTTTATAKGTSAAVTVTAAAVSKLLAATGTPQSATVGTAFANPLVVEALDAYSNPVSGASVTFLTPSTGASATIVGSPATTASSTGLASVTATANGTAGGPYSVGAYSGGATSATFALTNTAPIQTTFTVTNATDTTAGVAANCLTATLSAGSCSLRDALAAAAASMSSGLVVNFSPTVFTAAATITEANGTLNIPSNTTIQGLTTGSGATLTNLMTVSGNLANTVIAVASGVVGAAINNLTIRNGFSSATSAGGINVLGSLTINQSTIKNNFGTLTSGISVTSGVLTITGSTLSANGGTAVDGQAVFSNSSTLNITNSTVSGNFGVHAGLLLSGGTATLTGVTVSGNNGFGLTESGSGTSVLNNSIVEGNTTSTSGSVPDLVLSSQYANTITNSVVNTRATSSYPNLAILGSYGGPTQTMPALPSSPAFCYATSGSGTDQRGVSRSANYNGVGCADVGATNSNYSIIYSTNTPSTTPTYYVGSVISPNPVVSFEDNGFPVSWYDFTNAIISNDLAHPANSAVTAYFSGGTASVQYTPETTYTSDQLGSNYSFTTPANNTISFSVFSNPFNVVANGDTTRLNLSSTSPGSIGLGQAVNFTAVLQDVTNNSTVVTGGVIFTDVVGSTVTVLNGGNPVTLSGGVAALNNVILAGDGVHTITANYPGVTGSFNQSNLANLMITVGAATHFSVTAASPQVAGASFPATVTALDANNATATLYAGTVKITSSDSAAVLPANATLTNGVGTFAVTLNTKGSQTVTATDTVTGSIAGVSLAISVTGPPLFLVTVSTDTTTGVAANCPNQNATPIVAGANCSLRDALAAATALPTSSLVPAQITFSSTKFNAATTITLGNAGTLNVPTYTTVQGSTNGSGSTKTNLITVNGGGATIFTIPTSAVVTLSNLSITGATTTSGISSMGNLTVNACTVTANNAYSGGGIFAGAGQLTITNSSIFANRATVGGGITTFIPTTITNSTIANNSGVAGGGINSSSSVTLVHATITGNSASSFGGGIAQNSNGTSTTASNSIVAGNSSPTSPDASVLSMSVATSVFNASSSPLAISLAPIGSYGGPTQTMPAVPGSTALCAGSVANDGGLSTDQRGNPRSTTYGTTSCVDAGAIQMGYSIGFVQQPTNVQINSSISPSPTVQLYDNGAAIALSGASVGMTVAAGTLSGTTPQSTSSTGLATFNNLSIGSIQNSDKLTASIAVTSSISVTATSSSFNVGPVAVSATQAIASVTLTQSYATTSFTPVTGSGGTTPLAYSVSPTLPAGLSISSTTGAITGTPTVTSAATTYTVTVTDATSATAQATFSLKVSAAVTATQSVASTALTQNKAATSFIPVTGANGTGTLSYSISPTLPTGLSISAITGAIAGTPSATSVATTYTVTVTDSNGATATQTFSLKVNPAVTATQAVASTTLTQNRVATSFTPVTGANGTATLSYSVSPTLPTGLSFSASTGAITGTPSITSAATTYTVTVTDANSATATATFSLKVNAAVTATQAIASSTLTQNHATASFIPVTGANGTTPLSYTVSPALPAGLSMASSTGAITGTPSGTSAATTYTVTVTDANGATATATFSLTVNAAVTATQAVASTTLVDNQPATAFTPVTGAGGTGTLSYSVSPALPTGLSLAASTGTISGTPTVVSSATTYTVTVTDANSATATATFGLTVILSVPPTVASVSAVSTTYGSTTGITVTATESGTLGLATGGVVTFSITGPATGSFIPTTCTITSSGSCTTTYIPTGTLTAGTYTNDITASFAMVGSYSAASGSSTLTVNQDSQTINFTPPASPVIYGTGPYTLVATGGASGNPVTFSIVSGGAYGSLSGTNNATLTITGAGGTIVIAANQAANTNYSAATQVTQSVVVNQASQTITFAPASPVTFGVAPITLTATGGGSGNPVTYMLVSGPATLNGSTLTVTGAGSVVLSANQAGNANYTAASPVSATIVVNKALPSVALVSSVNPVLVQNAVTFTATLSSSAGLPANGDTVTFYDNTASAPLGTGSVTAGVATYTTSSLAVGTHSITAIFTTDANFLGAPSPALSEVVQDFSLTISTAAGSVTSQTVLPGAAATYSFTLSMTNGGNFPAAVALAVSGAPVGSVVTISPSTLAAGSGTTPVTLTIQTPKQQGKLERGGSIGKGLAPIAFALLLLPFTRRLRRSAKKLSRFASLALLLLAGAGAMAGLTGCGVGEGVFAQPQQTYTVTVTGTSGALSHSTTVTLTVQ